MTLEQIKQEMAKLRTPGREVSEEECSKILRPIYEEERRAELVEAVRRAKQEPRQGLGAVNGSAALVRRRNIVGNIMVEGGMWSDNLAIVLATYFSRHMERPGDDVDDTETGWGKWVLQKTDEALDLIAAEIFTEEKPPNEKALR